MVYEAGGQAAPPPAREGGGPGWVDGGSLVEGLALPSGPVQFGRRPWELSPGHIQTITLGTP